MEGGSHYRKGLWTQEEDMILMDYIRVHGKGRWNRVAKMTGLKRCGKSCRLRWMNYLSPNVKKGGFSEEEEDLIIRLHKLLGNRWSLIAGRVPGRTDNQVKNHWNTHLSKKLGVKKGKKKVSVSPLTVARDCKEERETLNLPTFTKPELPNFHDNGKAVELLGNSDSLQRVVQVSTSLEPEMNECFVGSFWFSNDNINPSTTSIMELLDEYPLDMVWNDL